MVDTDLKSYLLYLADNALILGHRLSEWCGHGPVLEQDIAMTNLALDHVGLARNLYQYLAELEGGDYTEDTYPFLRDVYDFKNVLLTELPNRDFGYTVVRHFLYDSWALHYYQALSQYSKDERLAAIAAKSIKEIKYHYKFSSEWMIRLGDGTEESHERVQSALDEYGPYAQELLIAAPYEESLAEQHIGIPLDNIRDSVLQSRLDVFTKATLAVKEQPWYPKGGKVGRHTEHLGYILADLQYYQRAYPGSEW